MFAFHSLAVNWSIMRSQMYDYNTSEVMKKIERSNFPLDVKIPTKVPFEEMSMLESGATDHQLRVRLLNKDKNVIEYRITNIPITYSKEIKQRKVVIHSNIEAVFIPKDTMKRILSWQDGDLYYEITYFSKVTPSELSKKQLVKMAESFN